MLHINNLTVAMCFGAVQLYLPMLWFCRRLERKPHWGLGLAASFAGCAVYPLLFPLERMGLFIHVPIYACALAMLLLSYRATLPVLLFIGTASATISHLGSLLGSCVTLLWPQQLAHFGVEIAINWKAYFVMWLCYFAVCGLIQHFFLRQIGNIGMQRLATGPVVAISVAMLVVNQVLGMYFELYAAPNAAPQLHFLEYVWNALCCLFCLAIQFGIFHSSRQEQELEISRRLMTEKEQQYNISKSTMEAINRKSHDLKYQLTALAAGQKDRRPLDEALALVESFDAMIHTGNETLDVIFAEKTQFCQQQGIGFVCMIDGARLNFMDTTDQYVLFGNIIDNALNAVRSLPPEVDRSIYMDVHAEKKLLLIRTENPFAGTLQFRDGLPRTSTGDELNHGYGMSSIRMICEKYGGSISTRAEDGRFYLNAVLPLKG